MTLAARHVALLALLAFLPTAAYAYETGEFTVVIAVMGILNVLIIATSLVTLFGAGAGSEDVANSIP